MMNSLHPVMMRILAVPSQDDVLRSISQNVGSSADSSRTFALVLCMAAILVLLLVINHRRNRELTPRALNHQGKLTREVIKSIGLKPHEVKQLKTLAEERSCSSPLVLLLCPSVLSKAAQANARRKASGENPSSKA